MNFEVSMDIAGIEADIQADIGRALPILSQQILQDCNYFCKQDQGGLIASSLSKSDLAHGELIWDTAYAAMQYYLGTASHDVNPHATKMWCEKAYSRFGREWEALLQRLIENGGGV